MLLFGNLPCIAKFQAGHLNTKILLVIFARSFLLKAFYVSRCGHHLGFLSHLLHKLLSHFSSYFSLASRCCSFEVYKKRLTRSPCWVESWIKLNAFSSSLFQIWEILSLNFTWEIYLIGSSYQQMVVDSLLGNRLPIRWN